MADSQVFTSPANLIADRAAVTAQVRASGTSFFWAMRFLPRERREAIYAVYAFCREVDDIADGTLTPPEKRSALDQWRMEIGRLFDGVPDRPITRALLEPVRLYRLEQEAFLAIIDGMQMDADGPIRAPSWAELDLYCARVASAVGLLCVRIFGMAGEDGRALAGSLGRALQLTNILRDLHEDAELGRLYLPRELLEKTGIKARDPRAVLAASGLREVAEAVGREARLSYKAAETIMQRADKAQVRPARIMMEVYVRALDHMERTDFATVGMPRRTDGFHGALSKLMKLGVALRYGLG